MRERRELSLAVGELLIAICKELRIDKLVEWLNALLTKVANNG